MSDGFVPKTDDWQAEVGWADVIVFDDVQGQGEKAVKLRVTVVVARLIRKIIDRFYQETPDLIKIDSTLYTGLRPPP